MAGGDGCRHGRPSHLATKGPGLFPLGTGILCLDIILYVLLDICLLCTNASYAGPNEPFPVPSPDEMRRRETNIMPYKTYFDQMVAKAKADGWTEGDIAITWREASDVVQQKHPALLQRDRDSFFWAQDLAVWTAYCMYDTSHILHKLTNVTGPNEPFPVPEPALGRRQERERQEAIQRQLASRSATGQQTNRNTASTAVQPAAPVASTITAPAARGYAQQQTRTPATQGARGLAQSSTLQPAVPALVPASQATSSKVAAVGTTTSKAAAVIPPTQSTKMTAPNADRKDSKVNSPFAATTHPAPRFTSSAQSHRLEDPAFRAELDAENGKGKGKDKENEEKKEERKEVLSAAGPSDRQTRRHRQPRRHNIDGRWLNGVFHPF